MLVDLSAPPCGGIPADGTTAAITVSLEGGALTEADADAVAQTFAPRGIAYTWRWPAGTTDGWEGQVAWSATGEGAAVAQAGTPYQVVVDQCVTIELTPACSPSADAGVR